MSCPVVHSTLPFSIWRYGSKVLLLIELMTRSLWLSSMILTLNRSSNSPEWLQTCLLHVAKLYELNLMSFITNLHSKFPSATHVKLVVWPVMTSLMPSFPHAERYAPVKTMNIVKVERKHLTQCFVGNTKRDPSYHPPTIHTYFNIPIWGKV